MPTNFYPATHSSIHFHLYSSFGTAIDLRSDANGPGNNKLPRELIVIDAGSGTLAVTRADGTTVTITPVSAGQRFPIAAATIVATTDVGSVLVLW